MVLDEAKVGIMPTSTLGLLIIFFIKRVDSKRNEYSNKYDYGYK